MAGKDLIQYPELLQKLKERIKTARQKAILAVNNELLRVYWEIGNAIAVQEENAGWGGKIVDKLAADLKSEFSEMRGLSPRNLRYMRDFALAYPDFLQQVAASIELPENKASTILQQAAAKLPWGHHLVLLTKLKTIEERTFYIQKSVENGWSRNILIHQIESGLHRAQGALINNFRNTLPDYQSELTEQVFKDPYNFDFIMLGEQAKERDLENALMRQVTKVLLELGVGFAFMGRQMRFETGGREFIVDLLFYHTKLRRYVIIELKLGEFEPEYVSKMNLYLGLADDQLKGEKDESSIGLILCKSNNKIIAEYALRDTSKPIGIAEYKIAERLPDNISGELPSIEEIESRVDEEMKENQNPIDSKWSVVRDKLRGLNKGEIKTQFTFEIFQDLFFNSLYPMYERLIQNVTDHFAEEFMKVEFKWNIGGPETNSIDQLKVHLRDKQNWNNHRQVIFTCLMSGLKKAGTDSLSIWFHLNLELEDYCYGFKSSMTNYNETFLKKLYHETLTDENIRLIEQMQMDYIIARIEEYLNQNT